MNEGLTYKAVKADNIWKLLKKLDAARAEGWVLEGKPTLETDGNVHQLMTRYHYNRNETRLQLA